jgi:suppressor for copper-sensitivity B
MNRSTSRTHGLLPGSRLLAAAGLWLVAALTFLSGAPSALAQWGFGPSLEAEGTLFARQEGDELRIALRVRVEPGWYLYHDDLGPEDAVGKPTTVRLSAPGVDFGPARFPEPERFEQEIGARGKPTWIWGHKGELVIYARGELQPGAEPPALDSIEAIIDGLTCEELCVPYREELIAEGPGPDALFATFPADLEGPEAVTASSQTDSAPAPGGVREDLDYASVEFPEFRARESLDGESSGAAHGLAVWLLLAFVAGMLLNIMPCVLPVISIKVLSFVQQAGEDRKRVLQLGTVFAIGILVVFWALAIVAISLKMSWGEQFQSTGFLVVMIGIVFAFALSLFGVYELGVPNQVGQMAGMRREGLGDALFKGMLATVLATPCSGPFLGSTLTWTLSQTPLVIFLIFTFLGLGMALPYVFLTAQPRLLKRLPKPGPWMETFKQGMGFLLLATVIFLMISLRQDLLLYTASFLVFIALGCWWYGRFATFDKTFGRRMLHLGVAGVMVFGGARWSYVEFQGFFQAEEENWVRFEPDVFLEHLEEGRTVFVDFTAKWCANCHYNKARVFDSDAVRAVMRERGVVPMLADITDDSPYTEMVTRLMNQLGGRSIPFLAVFPGDRPDQPIVRHAIVTRAEMIEIFEAMPQP